MLPNRKLRPDISTRIGTPPAGDRLRVCEQIRSSRLAPPFLLGCSHAESSDRVFFHKLSVRHECLDHVLVLSDRHLRRMLTAYFAYYHRTRTHLSLDKDAPDGRTIEPPGRGTIIPIPEVGGLHHRYVRQAA